MTMLGVYPPSTGLSGIRPVPAQRTRTVPIVLYGNRWCGLTQLTGRALARAGLDYDYVDLDEHPSVARKLHMLAGGRLRTPVVYVDGEWLVAPSTGQLRAALMRAGAL